MLQVFGDLRGVFANIRGQLLFWTVAHLRHARKPVILAANGRATQGMDMAMGAHKPRIENALIAISLFAGLAALLIAWGMGDAEEAARSYQWETAFVGFGLLLAGQWLVGGTPNAKKQQIAATSAALALAGAGLTYHYGLGWGAAAPFVVA